MVEMELRWKFIGSLVVDYFITNHLHCSIFNTLYQLSPSMSLMYTCSSQPSPHPSPLLLYSNPSLDCLEDHSISMN